MVDTGCSDCKDCLSEGPQPPHDGLAHRVGNAVTLGAVDRHECPSCGHARKHHSAYEGGGGADVSGAAWAQAADNQGLHKR